MSLTTKAPESGAVTVSGANKVQGEERILRTETRIVDGQPVTKTYVKTRKYSTDPETGRVLQEVTEQELPKEQAEAEQSKVRAEFEAMEKTIQEEHHRIQSDIRRMHHDMARMWKALL